MKNLFYNSLMIAALNICLTSFAAEENGIGRGGGDGDPQTFKSAGTAAVEFIRETQKTDLDFMKSIPLEKLEKIIEGAKVKFVFTDHKRLKPRELMLPKDKIARDAVNSPRLKKIWVDTEAWQEHAAKEGKQIAFAFHEFLGLARIKDSKYELSNLLEARIALNHSKAEMKLQLKTSVSKYKALLTSQMDQDISVVERFIEMLKLSPDYRTCIASTTNPKNEHAISEAEVTCFGLIPQMFRLLFTMGLYDDAKAAKDLQDFESLVQLMDLSLAFEKDHALELMREKFIEICQVLRNRPKRPSHPFETLILESLNEISAISKSALLPDQHAFATSISEALLNDKRDYQYQSETIREKFKSLLNGACPERENFGKQIKCLFSKYMTAVENQCLPEYKELWQKRTTFIDHISIKVNTW